MEKREADLSMNLALTGAREKVVDYSVAYIGWSLSLSWFLSWSLSLSLSLSFSLSLSSEPKRRHSSFYPSDDPLTFSVSSPLPLPQVLKTDGFTFKLKTSDTLSVFSQQFVAVV